MKMFLSPVLLVLVIIAGSVWPIYHWHNQPQSALKTMITAGVICLVMAIISMAPFLVAIQRQAGWAPQALLAGTGLRLLLTLTACVIVIMYYIEPGQTRAFGLWMVGFYLVLLVWETITAIKIVRKRFENVPKTPIPA